MRINFKPLFHHFSGANTAANVKNEGPEPAERGEPAEEVAQGGLRERDNITSAEDIMNRDPKSCAKVYYE